MRYFLINKVNPKFYPLSYLIFAVFMRKPSNTYSTTFNCFFFSRIKMLSSTASFGRYFAKDKSFT